MSDNYQDPSVGKPVHIEHPKKLAEALRRQQNKQGADAQVLAKKQARQHERLNRVADAGNKR
jgi:hypothetical protein